MGQVLDSSILIAAERKKFDLASFLLSLPEMPLAISTVTYSELLHGLWRASDPHIRSRRRRFIDDILLQANLLDFGPAGAEKHAEIWAALEIAGTPIGPHDLLIAATVLAHDYSLATLNEKEFAHVPGLKLAHVAPFKIV